MLRNGRPGGIGRLRYAIDLMRITGFRPDRSGLVRLFGYEIDGSRPDQLRHLVREIFADFSYFVPLQKRSPVIFDIGSNMGIASLFFKRLFPDSVLFCFEPDPDTYALLRGNIERNRLKDVHTFNVGISDTEGKARLFVPSWSSGSSSLFAEKIEIEREFAGRGSGVPCGPALEKEIEVMRCSDFIAKEGIEHIDLLKIDAEGAEERIVNDLSSLLPMIDVIILEFHYARDFLINNSLARILAFLERESFLVSVKPTWITVEPKAMSTYVVKAVNGNSAFGKQDLLKVL